MPKLLVATSPESGATKVGPKRWRKHLFPFGRKFVHPKDRSKVLEFTREFAERMIANFNAGVRDIVPVPSKHSEDWEDNHGRVLALEMDEAKGVFCVIEVDEVAGKAIDERKLAGVSGSFDPDYLDRESGNKIGPVLRHVALTNGPYIEGMDGFEPIALSEPDGSADDDESSVSFYVLSETKPDKGGKDTMTLEELKAALKADHGIDVDALTADAEAGSAARAHLDKVRAAFGDGVQLSEDSFGDDAAAAIVSLSEDKNESKTEVEKLSEQVVSLTEKIEANAKEAKRKDAERLVEPYVKAGHITPAEKDTYVSLAEANPETAKVVLGKFGDAESLELSELGSSLPKEDDKIDEAAEIERLTAGLKS